jgi:hypothetical protein
LGVSLGQILSDLPHKVYSTVSRHQSFKMLIVGKVQGTRYFLG